MRQITRPHVLAWLLTGLLAFLLFAAGPLILVAMTNLMLWSESGAQTVLWILTVMVGALKASAIAAIVLTGVRLLRRAPS